MLENRHPMSHVVREEVSAKSREWGYMLGSIYIRKVHFRDVGMIQQIEQKVVNRLRQVTVAIQQDGANRVNVIRSTAERSAAVEFARGRRHPSADRGRGAGADRARTPSSPTPCSSCSRRRTCCGEPPRGEHRPQGTQLIAAVSGAGGILTGQQ